MAWGSKYGLVVGPHRRARGVRTCQWTRTRSCRGSSLGSGKWLLWLGLVASILGPNHPCPCESPLLSCWSWSWWMITHPLVCCNLLVLVFLVHPYCLYLSFFLVMKHSHPCLSLWFSAVCVAVRVLRFWIELWFSWVWGGHICIEINSVGSIKSRVGYDLYWGSLYLPKFLVKPLEQTLFVLLANRRNLLTKGKKDIILQV